MPVTVRMPAISWRRPALPLALVAALLPFPMAVMAAACSGGAGATDAAATTGGAPDGTRPGVAGIGEQQSGQDARAEAATRRSSLARTITDDPFADSDLLYVPLFGDLDAMVERDAIRALVPMSKTFYFLDGAQQRGISYEGMQMFEEQINASLERGHLRVHVVMIPVARDELIDGLVEGYGDIALGNITITPTRRELVDFSDPFLTDVAELVVTGPQSPELSSLDDLSGQEVMVRASSSYYESLQALNARFREEGKEEIELTLASEVLEDEDLLEMVNAGLIPIVIVDSHKAQLWEQIFTDLVVHEELAIATGGHIGWAFRKDSPQLAAAINEFVVDHKKGTLLGNMAFNRYLRDTKWAVSALNDEGRARLDTLIGLFQTYGERYDMPAWASN